MRYRTIILWLFLFMSACARGNEFFVTDVNDGNQPNQLRGAVAAAVAAGPGPHTIHLPAGDFNLTLGTIYFGASPITIHFIGEGRSTKIIMSNTNRDRIFAINYSGTIPNVHASFTGVDFYNGYLTSDQFGGGAILCGGPSNSLSLKNCLFVNNSIAPSAGTNGGALSMSGGGSLTIDSCYFNQNNNPAGSGGALFYHLYAASGSLRITNSNFMSNVASDLNASGGAIGIEVLPAQGATTSEIVIQKNNFENNRAESAGGDGGAISIRNDIRPGNTAYINYNRFSMNSAANSLTAALEMIGGSGHVDATNNWWGCNNGAVGFGGCGGAGITGTISTGLLSLTPWLQLRTSPASSSLCVSGETSQTTITAFFHQNSAGELIDQSNLSVFNAHTVAFMPVGGSVTNVSAFNSEGIATCTFISDGTAGAKSVTAMTDFVPSNDPVSRSVMTANNPPAITFHPVNRMVCPGNQVSFSAEGEGEQLDYQWYRGTEPLTDGTTASGSLIEGASTPTMSIKHTTEADGSSEYHVKISRLGCAANSANVELFVNPLNIQDQTGTIVAKVSASNHAVNNSSCHRYALVQPAGTDPVNGELTVSVTISGSQLFHNGQPYVRRYYNITPAENPHNATANVTLYFRQLDFDLYNAARPGAEYDLPNDPADMRGRNNLRITQYHGSGTIPGTYTGWTGDGPAAVLINPGAENVVWNNDHSWWEVSFPVTGFSGFFVTGLIDGALPVTIHRITASPSELGIMVEWQVSDEVNFRQYEVETSADGTVFHTAGIVNAANKTLYNFLHTTPAAGTNYYRLKLVDIDGNFSYSRTVSCMAGGLVNRVTVMRNPFVQNLQLKVDVQNDMHFKLQLADQAGRLLMQKTIYVSRGLNTITLPEVNSFSIGIYVLRVSGHGLNKTMKVVKTE